MHRQGRIPQNYNSSEPIYERVRGKTSSFPRSRSCLVTQVEEGGALRDETKTGELGAQPPPMAGIWNLQSRLGDCSQGHK